MKNFYNLWLVALVLGFVGCAVDGVEEEKLAINGSSYLVVDIATPHTKVSLGDKGADGKYGAYWNEGDKISVNGYLSEEVVINTENPRSAKFEVKNAELVYPYEILYPASLSNMVEFKAVQNYVANSFEAGAAPMYGCVSNNRESIKLNHLSGVLRLSVKSANDHTALSRMVIKAEEGYIAGAFSVDFATGKIAPSESLSNTVEYLFGEGLELSSADAKSFFVTLPCGEFGICSADLYTTDGRVMRLRFRTSGAYAIQAGVVREFGVVTFKNGAIGELMPLEAESDDVIIDNNSYMKVPTTVDGEYLVINDAQELMWLSYNGQVAAGVTYNKIRIGTDIEMGKYRKIALPAMKLNDGTEIDGNGKTITGVNMGEKASSIFGDGANLYIHDLTLTDCSVNTTLQTGAAILVGNVSEGLTVSNVIINDCSVVAPCKIGMVAGALHDGAHSISGINVVGGVVETSYVSGVSGVAGGLVGYVGAESGNTATIAATFTNCSTSATVKSYMEGTNTFYGKMVGQLSGYNGDEKLYFVGCDGSNATLVPMFDKGKKYAQTARLSYCDEHRAEFCQTALTSATDNLLGGECYCRGEVYFEGSRFVSTWDGTRSATMLTSVENGITTYYVYSAYDLAKAAGQSYNDAKKLVFKADVDMGGYKFKPINYVRNLDGEGHTVYNVKVERTHDAANNRGAGFIVYANNTTTHQNITLSGFDVTCNHDASIPALEYGNDEDGGAGNGYAGVLVSRAYGTYTASNVHVKDSKVRGVCKVGGLIGTISSGTVNIDGCSVDNTTIENYDPQVVNYYKMKIEKDIIILGELVVEALQWWYTAGECGGLIGFVMATSATINNCSVTNSKINCIGQPNKETVANIWNKSKYVEGAYTSGESIQGGAKTVIAGRHVNQFIGDIRSKRTETQQKENTGEYTTTISNYTVSGNTYNGVAAESTNDYNHNYASGKYCPVVGCAYYIGVDVSIIVSVHFQHCAGTLTFNEKGGSATTLTENTGSGSSMSWFGGGSTDVSISSYTSYYPEAPTE